MRISQLGRAALGFACSALLATGLAVAVPGAQVAVAQPPNPGEPLALPAGFALQDTGTGLGAWNLTDFGYLPDDTIIATGKTGAVQWIGPNGPKTLITLPVRINNDIGLTGLEIAPDYATSKQIYLARTINAPTGGGFISRISRWTVTGGAEPTGLANEQVLLDVPGTIELHSASGMVADNSGNLWVSVGDNADTDTWHVEAFRSQDVNSVYGKILRINAAGAGVPDNPFYDAGSPNSVKSKVFAKGFRNPFRLSLDKTSGLPVVGDVGWGTWEELNYVVPGGNYSWPCFEGNGPTPAYSTQPQCNGVTNNPPLWTYQHGMAPGQGNSVVAGFTYTGDSYPAQYKGQFFFGDYVSQRIWTLKYNAQGQLVQAPVANAPFGTGLGGPVEFAAAPNGDVVYADIASGNVRRVVYVTGNIPPVAKATSTTDPATRTVTFDGTKSMDFDGPATDLTYTWNFGDGTTGTGATVSHTYPASPAKFTATLTVKDKSNGTNSTTLTVAPSNHSPVLTLTTPADGKKFRVGEQINLTGTATDNEDGPLTIAWSTEIVHCAEETTCHVHPNITGSGGSFSMPFTDHTDSRIEFTAKVTDSQGVSTSKVYVARPNEFKLTLKSNFPASLVISGESNGNVAMVTEGATPNLIAGAKATDGVASFSKWDDGSTNLSRAFTMPAADTVVNVTYQTPIDSRYNSDAAVRTLLGNPVAAEVNDSGTRYRAYERGRLYSSPQTSAVAIYGTILTKYLALGGHQVLGAPTNDETATPDGVGRYNAFTGNWSIYYTPGTGAHSIGGPIRDKWGWMGWENGILGYPLTDQVATPTGGGQFVDFTNNASIYWLPTTPGNGTAAVYSQIRSKWLAMGGATGVLGMPITDELVGPNGGRYNNFSNYASIYWHYNSPGSGAWSIMSQIRDRWVFDGGAGGFLGYPVTDEWSTPDGIGRYNHFANNGSIYWTPAYGAQSMCCQIKDKWASLGWEKSYLGYPTSSEYTPAGQPTWRRQNYQGGFITWKPSTGAVDHK
ncbi:PQQ-dependent sugar dehydrogenase [Saccharothrix sp. AJ9571]|nr:PQQ-dependent sugar dehydrogenase [Saccharothrix sp. AJ9571]